MQLIRGDCAVPIEVEGLDVEGRADENISLFEFSVFNLQVDKAVVIAVIKLPAEWVVRCGVVITPFFVEKS